MGTIRRNPIEAEQEVMLRGKWQRALMAFHEHAQECHQCSGGRNLARTACPAGWELIKATHAASVELRTWVRAGEQAHDDGQGTLW